MIFNFSSISFQWDGKNRDFGNVTRERVEAFCIGNGKWNLEGKMKKIRNKFYQSSQIVSNARKD